MPEQRTGIEAGATIGDRYRLERKLGVGGMAEVWLATDTRLGRAVALKLLSESLIDDPGFVERFGREARIAAGLSHPALVPVHDLGMTGERPFLVMEYVDGETLAQRIDRAPETVDVEALATEMLGALEHVHEAGIIHRDIKPGNILYEDHGRIRLMDFGIARMAGGTEITQSGQVLGTLRYLAPELRTGDEPGPASDLYSLGVVLADCRERTGAGEGLQPLIVRLRSADPQRRPVSARAALRELGRTVAADPDAPPPERTEQLPPARRVLAETSQRQPPFPETETDPEPAEAAGPPTDRQAATVEPAAERTGPAAERRPAAERSRYTRRGRGRALAMIGLLGAAAIVVVLVLALGGGDESGGPAAGPGSGDQRAQSGSGSASAGGDGENGGGGETGSADVLPEPVVPGDPDEGAALNNEGYGLLQSGRAEEAVPILERAVAAFGDQTGGDNYAYALFNYGWALREAGRPEEAIPVLRERLKVDNQRDVVRAELQRARAEAGE